MRRVVDTNVVVVANGRDEASRVQPACRLAAAQALRRLLSKGRIVIDTAGEMLDEYRRYCHPRGQPGVGDRFFREVLMSYGGRVERIFLPKRNDGSFENFPDDPRLVTFDRSDRKFAAAARVVLSPVMNAVDTDWLYHKEALSDNGIEVEFICGCGEDRWFLGDS